MAAKKTSRTILPVYAGTSGWAYATWKPGFYPPDTKARQFLEHYASRLNTVEVNYTFSKLPTEAMVASWLAATPETFRFSFKAPQRITHFRRLKECDVQLREFLASIAAVREAGRMGALLFQLPPNFKADAARLKSFLREPALRDLPHARIAFEFRHPSWFSEECGEEVFDVLRNCNAALCIAESDDLVSPEIHTAPFAYYRLRKSVYSSASLEKISAKLAARAAEGAVYAYFKHEDAPDGPLRAEAVLQRVRAAKPPARSKG